MAKNSLFSRILFYTSIESILYQAILCTHQMLLFRFAGKTLYGQAGALFSGIFLLVLYLNVGLDISFAPLFSQASRSKYTFKEMVLKQLLGVCSIPLMLIGLYLIYPTKMYSLSILTLCGLLIFVESAKKSVRTILHLALLQKTVALVEIATLSTYVTIVWTYILSGRSLNLYVILTPMLISSLGALGIYFYRLYIFYTELSDTGPTEIDWQTIGSTRLKNWIYQIVHSLYSSNFLVLSAAQLYGFELAALLKMMSFCAYSINYIVQHVFGITSSVLFAHTFGDSNFEKQQLFATVRSKLSYIMPVLPLALLAYHWYLSIAHPELCTEHGHIISLFMLLLFSENITVTHEQYFIV